MAKIRQANKIWPIWGVDPNLNAIVSKNGDLTMAYEVKMPEIFTASEGEYDNLSDLFANAIKNLPVGYIFHKQDWYVAKEYEPNLDNELIHNSNFIAYDNEMHFAERPYIDHRSYIYITSPSAKVTKRDSLKSSLLKRHVVPQERFEPAMIAEFLETCEKFKYQMASSGKVKVRSLSIDEIVGNKNKGITGVLHDYSTFSYDDPTIYEWETGNNGSMVVGNKHAFCYSIAELQDFPSSLTNIVNFEPFSSERFKIPVSLGSCVGLGLSFNHLYNQIIVIEDKDALEQTKIKEIKNHSSLAEWSKDNQVSIVEKDNFLLALKKDNRVPVLAHFNVFVWSEDKDLAESYRSITSSAIANMGFSPRQVKSELATLYWSCIPGNSAEIGEDNLGTLFVDEAVCLFSMEANYNDSAFSPNGIRMTDRFGKPVMVDPFIEPRKRGLISNRNVFIVGPSGTGKSFLLNNMVYYLRCSNAHVSIVDVGGSYKRICDILGGRYITYDINNPISFNPFYFKNFSPDEDDKEGIRDLLKGLWKSDDERVSKAEDSTLGDIIHQYYINLRKERKTGNKIFPCMNTFYEFARDIFPQMFADNGGREDKEFDLKNFLYVLKQFYKGGQYHYLLNSQTNIDLVDEPLIVYELDNIKDHPVLFPVTAVMIMTTYVRKLSDVKGVLKALLIEEAWKALATPRFEHFLKWASKTVRKHYGILGVVTQELDDLIGSDIVKNTIINNSDIKFLLDQTSYENRFDEVSSLLGLGPKEEAVVQSVGRSIDPNRPPYREVAMFLKNYGKVYGIEVSSTAYAAFTTEKSEVEEIVDLQNLRYHGNTERAIRAFAKGERIAS